MIRALLLSLLLWCGCSAAKTQVDEEEMLPAGALPDVVEAGAPEDIRQSFRGEPGGAPPRILYPFDQTLMAPNVLQLRVEWEAPPAYHLYRLVVEGPGVYQRFFLSRRSSGGGGYNIGDALWSVIAHSNLGREVTLTLSGTAQRGAAVGTAPPLRVRFAPQDTRGGLYYFSPTIRGIKRVPLGAKAPVDFVQQGNGTGCAGCHAVSRDGRQVAVEFGSGQTRLGSSVVDGLDAARLRFPLEPQVAWNFAWFHPAGELLVTNWNGALHIREAQTGRLVREVPPALLGGEFGAAMPEWSPDGRYLAFVRLRAQPDYDFALRDSGDIAILPYNDGAFGPARTLVEARPGEEVHFWPSWSPDGRFLVFNSQRCAGAPCEQYDAQRTRLRLVRALGDDGQPVAAPPSAPVELLRGTHQPEQSNNWPKFAPFLQDGRLAFVVYSAKFGWGYQRGGTPQLFMFAVDLQQVGDGDPSFAPVWLPFQEQNTANHSAIWTTDVVCKGGGDCPAEFGCQSGVCVPVLQ